MPIDLTIGAAVGSLVLVTIACIFWLGAPPVSSSRREANAVIELLRPHAPTAITDLGAGWGALAQRLGLAFPQTQVTAYEISPLPFVLAWLRCSRTPNVRVRFADFRRAPLHGALVCYLARKSMREVEHLPAPGALVVSICFLFRNRTPERVIRATPLGGDVALYRWR